MRPERDKTKKQKELFISILQKTPIILAACNGSKVSRASVYRWMNDDLEFKSLVDETIKLGLEDQCDIIERELFKKSRDGHFASIKYFLSKNHPKYSESKKNEEKPETKPKKMLIVEYGKDYFKNNNDEEN